MAYKGRYNPQHPKKYKGDHHNIIYRSLWERKFMVYCDTSDNIIEWGSEEIIIPYLSPWDGRMHRYFPDFYIKVKQTNGNIKEYIIEVKPKRQTKPPKKGKSRRRYLYEQFTWTKNQAKWEAAKQYCKKRKWEFKIVTEKELGIGYK